MNGERQSKLMIVGVAKGKVRKVRKGLGENNEKLKESWGWKGHGCQKGSLLGDVSFNQTSLMVMIVSNSGIIVIDQGAEPISAPCLLILNIHGLCTCMYLCM